MRLMFPLILVLLATGCTDPSASRAALTKSGFTDITIGGYDAWSCGEGDAYSTSFTATNPNGMRVSGVVCCGTFKRCTVRF
jgi:hypothetical protein